MHYSERMNAQISVREHARIQTPVRKRRCGVLFGFCSLKGKQTRGYVPAVLLDNVREFMHSLAQSGKEDEWRIFDFPPIQQSLILDKALSYNIKFYDLFISEREREGEGERVCLLL